MSTYKQQLEVVRRYTGDAFKSSRGYDARKPPSFGKRMAVLKYFRKIQELTGVETQVYTPKRGEKTEAFAYTGQSGFRKFTKAIVRKVTPDQNFAFQIDKSRPKGSRFVATDKKTGRRYYNLPAYLFESEDNNADHYEDIIREHAEDAEFFLISAGESYMWGSGGGHRRIAEKLAEIFRNYSATQFDAHDRNSSYYGNWFRGITGFTDRFDILPEIGAAIRKQNEYRARFGIKSKSKFRKLIGYDAQGNGLMGEFENGTLLRVVPIVWEKKR